MPGRCTRPGARRRRQHRAGDTLRAVRISLVTPYAWDRPHEANDHWAPGRARPGRARARGRHPRAGAVGSAAARRAPSPATAGARRHDSPGTGARQAAGRRGGPRECPCESGGLGAQRGAAGGSCGLGCGSRSPSGALRRRRLPRRAPAGPVRARATRKHRADDRHVVPPRRERGGKRRGEPTSRSPRRSRAKRARGAARRPSGGSPASPSTWRASPAGHAGGAAARRGRVGVRGPAARSKGLLSGARRHHARRSRCCTTLRRAAPRRRARAIPAGRVHVARRVDAGRPRRRAARRERSSWPRGAGSALLAREAAGLRRARRRAGRLRPAAELVDDDASGLLASREGAGGRRRRRRPAAGRRRRCALASGPAVARPRRRRRRPRSAARVAAVYESGRAAPSRRPQRRPRATGTVAAILCDFHMHTDHSRRLRRRRCPTSCSRALELGLGAIAVTDHNTIAGGVAARAYVEEHGLPLHVVVGSEVKTATGEVIGLYLEEEIPRGMPFADTVEAIRAQGALVYVPPPVRPHARDPRPRRCCGASSTRSTCWRPTTHASTGRPSTATRSASPSDTTTCSPAPAPTRTSSRASAPASVELPRFDDAGVPAPGAGSGPDRAPSRRTCCTSRG